MVFPSYFIFGHSTTLDYLIERVASGLELFRLDEGPFLVNKLGLLSTFSF